jgi:hypothetical protein
MKCIHLKRFHGLNKKILGCSNEFVGNDVFK